jgi:hypothetical protein
MDFIGQVFAAMLLVTALMMMATKYLLKKYDTNGTIAQAAKNKATSFIINRLK